MSMGLTAGSVACVASHPGEMAEGMNTQVKHKTAHCHNGLVLVAERRKKL